jgi:8-oxo-dGTP pyrophosphatase MutT (NUDIX family)
MYRTDLRDRLEGSLDDDPRHEAAAGDRLASVLVPLVEGTTLLFTKRTEHLPRHPGEISFPGGLQHDEDADIQATALRETEEELGIAPSTVDVLGALPSFHTFVSSILIVPFVGVLDPRPELRPNPGEIAEVLEYPVEALIDAETAVEWRRDRGVYRGYAYEMDDHTIWGATAMILHSFLDLIRRDDA